MKNTNKLLLLALLLLSLATSAFSQVPSPITEQQAIDIAKQQVIDTGKRPPEWFGGTVKAHFDGEIWLIMFMAKRNEGEPNLTSSTTFVFVHVSPDGKVLDNYPIKK